MRGGKPLTQIEGRRRTPAKQKKHFGEGGERRKESGTISGHLCFLSYIRCPFPSTSPFLPSSPCVSCIMSCELRRNEGDNVKGTNKKVRKHISFPHQTSDHRGNDP